MNSAIFYSASHILIKTRYCFTFFIMLLNSHILMANIELPIRQIIAPATPDSVSTSTYFLHAYNDTVVVMQRIFSPHAITNQISFSMNAGVTWTNREATNSYDSCQSIGMLPKSNTLIKCYFAYDSGAFRNVGYFVPSNNSGFSYDEELIQIPQNVADVLATGITNTVISGLDPVNIFLEHRVSSSGRILADGWFLSQDTGHSFILVNIPSGVGGAGGLKKLLYPDVEINGRWFARISDNYEPEVNSQLYYTTDYGNQYSLIGTNQNVYQFGTSIGSSLQWHIGKPQTESRFETLNRAFPTRQFAARIVGYKIISGLIESQSDTYSVILADSAFPDLKYSDTSHVINYVSSGTLENSDETDSIYCVIVNSATVDSAYLSTVDLKQRLCVCNVNSNACVTFTLPDSCVFQSVWYDESAAKVYLLAVDKQFYQTGALPKHETIYVSETLSTSVSYSQNIYNERNKASLVCSQYLYIPLTSFYNPDSIVMYDRLGKRLQKDVDFYAKYSSNQLVVYRTDCTAPSIYLVTISPRHSILWLSY